ncbi:MAG: hypothetical protein E7427_03870 [Ruminococcaceae bacterium]|nr:hypothetical protein [Oscillospiraceae bacterium]
MEQASVYRKASVERISSPEQLNDYLRVTNLSVWIVLAAVVLLLVGTLIWASLTYIGSSVSGVAAVDDGVMTVRFDDPALEKNVEAGMSVTVGDTASPIISVGHGADGRLFAQAETALANGTYEATVQYKRTQIIRLLFN